MKTIPFMQVSRAFGAESIRWFQDEARAMVARATWGVPRPVIGLLDRISKKFLERSGQKYQEEIAAVAWYLGRPGAYFLNANYEWGCTVKAYDTPRGPELVRVLDWATPGLGDSVIMLKIAGDLGYWYTPSWPGFVGAIHAFAPGRFAIALNQAPLYERTGSFYLDWALERKRVWNSGGMLPVHLVRTVMEQATNYSHARALLLEAPLCGRAIFSIVGTEPGECSIIERSRYLSYLARTETAANHFVACPDDGHHRGHHSVERARALAEIECDPSDKEFSWLQQPVMNSRTVLAFIANPSLGTFDVCGIDKQARVTETFSI